MCKIFLISCSIFWYNNVGRNHLNWASFCRYTENEFVNQRGDPFEIFGQNFFYIIGLLSIYICFSAPINVISRNISQCDSMRDVIFPLPGLAGGDEFGGTVIFKNLLNSNLYYTISIQNFMLYNLPRHHFSIR